MIVVFVPDIPEFKIVMDGVRHMNGAINIDHVGGYWRIASSEPIVFKRREMGLGPALWNCLLSGGFVGKLTEFSRDTLILQPDRA